MGFDLEEGVTGVFHVKQRRRGSRGALAGLVVLAALGGCEGSRRSGPFFRGERDRSASVRASQARPTPGDDAAHPLGRDRFGIDEALERQRADHRNEHGEGSLRLEGFSHPACAGIEPARKRRCPFLAVRWGRARDLPGAVEVELQEEVDVAELRREMLCHLAFGRTGSETRCPLHVEGVQVRSERRAGRWVFQLAAEGKRLEELRARIRRLVR